MTDGSEAPQHRSALEALISNNPELERLEALVADFSPFVAMGWTHQEARHSSFLRWFLDPAETHGLGAYPLRAFLKEVLDGGGDAMTPSVFDADIWALEKSIVLAEWECIDLLVRNDDERFAIVIENKVGTREHSSQLQRYRRVVETRLPDYKRAFFYLTPDGESPSDETYQPISYALVAELVERVRSRRSGQLSVEVDSFLAQYAELVRRHIVEDSEIQALSRQIYEKHRLALDLIYEHRPDRALEISELLQEVIREQDGVELDHCSKGYIRFTTPVLNRFAAVAEGWTKSRRLILFELVNQADRVILKLLLGPGPAPVREFIHHRITEIGAPFTHAHYKFYPKWWTFYGRKWLTSKQYRENTLEDLRERVRVLLADLVEKDLPALEAALAPIADEVRERFGERGMVERVGPSGT